ncbi:hypothetical protein V8C42DRAFT_358226, partial [Trichoderma barbatum]
GAFSQPRCVPVQYDYHYSTRGDETVLVREPIEQPQPRCQPLCLRHCETDISASMNVNPPTEYRGRHHGNRKFLKKREKKKGKSSRHKKKKKGSHRSHASRKDSRHYTESEVGSWVAGDENRYQVALWLGESSQTHGGTSSLHEAASRVREAAASEDNVSSLDGGGDGAAVDEPQEFPKPQQS